MQTSWSQGKKFILNIFSLRQASAFNPVWRCLQLPWASLHQPSLLNATAQPAPFPSLPFLTPDNQTHQLHVFDVLQRYRCSPDVVGSIAKAVEAQDPPKSPGTVRTHGHLCTKAAPPPSISKLTKSDLSLARTNTLLTAVEM